MRKILFILGTLFCSGLINAQELTTSEVYQPVAQQDVYNTKTTFYGSKASSSANNPCKGATTRVCGTIETKLAMTAHSFYDTSYMEIEVIKDTNGSLLNESINYITIPSNMPISNYIIEKYPEGVLEIFYKE